MSREHMHEFFKQFRYDPIAEGVSEISPYVYDSESVDRHFDKHMQQGKLHFSIMLNDQLIGDVYLKHINRTNKSCEMGIHLVNDNYKGKGYGTQAAMQMVEHAFCMLNIDVVYASTLITNQRSLRSLEKAGFTTVRHDEHSVYLECRKSRWPQCKPADQG